MRWFFHNRGVGGLGIVVRVEEKRVLPPSPGASIVQAPKGNALNDIFVFLEDGKQPGVWLLSD